MSVEPTAAAARPRGRIVILFRAGLGLVFFAAFLSLAAQLRLLIGAHGLLPLTELLARYRTAGVGWLDRIRELPTLFWLGDSDLLLTLVPVAGALLSLLLIAGLGGRVVVLLLWGLYLSCIAAGRDFFFYQWDNLLLEASLLAIWLPAGGRTIDLVRPDRRPPEPSPVVILLIRWLLFRLLFESALAKIVYGADDWLTLRAMTYYYETAPLPSWGGWLVQQWPLWFHQLSAVVTLLAEGLLPFLIFARHRLLRGAFVLLHAGFQLSIALTSNYGWFNLLAVVLSLIVLEDRDLRAWAAPRPVPARPTIRTRLARIVPFGLALVVLPATLIEGCAYFDRGPFLNQTLQPLRRLYAPLRSFNVYHLFPGVVRERIVAEIQGSRDGAAWSPLTLRDAPGDPTVAPPTTWLHNPRLPFTFSFLTLGRGSRDALYMHNLIDRICCDPGAIGPLMSPGPFHDAPPALLRFVFFRYRFGTWRDRAEKGLYWLREPARPPTSPLTCACPSSP